MLLLDIFDFLLMLKKVKELVLGSMRWEFLMELPRFRIGRKRVVLFLAREGPMTLFVGMKGVVVKIRMGLVECYHILLLMRETVQILS
jgi:hypothetical protein